MPLDALISRYRLSFPNLIKIDVDGNEHKIIEGMATILKDKRLKSFAIETNLQIPAHNKIKHILSSVGFRLLTGSQYRNVAYEQIGIPNLFFRRDS